MRWPLHRALVVFLSLLFVDCEESLNPKTEFKEQYVLQCLVGGGFDEHLIMQTALLARAYDVDGVDPLVNTTDPAVAGAEITLKVNGKQYFMREGFRPSVDSTRYGPRQRYYYIVMPAPKQFSDVSVVAKLPSGRMLTAQTTVPGSRYITSSLEFPKGLTSHINLQPGIRNWTIDWEDYEESWGHLFFPSLRIVYVIEGDVGVERSVLVPSRYVSGPNGYVPAYPSYSTHKFCLFDLSAIDSTMAQISAGDPDKSKYLVHAAMFEVMEYDTPLSKYFSSVSGSLDQFSIRVDQMVYSNVGGGIGVVGSYFKSWRQFDFNVSYVKSFGYQYR